MSLDHWRGIACLLVVINHATLPLCGDPTPPPAKHAAQVVSVETETPPAPAKKLNPIERVTKLLVFTTTRMHFGVEMFFVISGYCVTASAMSLRRSGKTITEYFRRRFLRIYPPFWCALLCSVLACFAIDRIYPGLLTMTPWPLPVPWELSPLQWLGCVTLTGTWIGYVTGQETLCFPIQSWTLCYEEQFYAVIGLLMACSGRHFFRMTALITAVVFAIDTSVLIFDFNIKGFFFDEYWFMFAAGVGVYWCLQCASKRPARAFQAALIAGIVALLILSRTTTLFGNGAHFSALRVIGALLFASMLIWLKPYDARIESIKWLKWLQSCGVMCYSIYLVHLFPGKVLAQYMLLSGFNSDFAILFVCIPICLVTSVALGYIFHVTVEQHFLATKTETKKHATSMSAETSQPETTRALAAEGLTLSFEEHRAKAGSDRDGQSIKKQQRKAA